MNLGKDAIAQLAVRNKLLLAFGIFDGCLLSRRSDLDASMLVTRDGGINLRREATMDLGKGQVQTHHQTNHVDEVRVGGP